MRAANSRGEGVWSASSPTVRPGAPGVPAGFTVQGGRQQYRAAWTAPADNGATITGYDLRHRVSGSNTWTTPYITTVNTGPGGTRTTGNQAPLNLGTVSGLGVTVTREALIANHHVYKVGAAVARLSVRVSGRQSSNKAARTIHLRYASSKPAQSTVSSHGTEVWSADLPTGGSFTGDGTIVSMPANGYFWVYGSNSGTEAIIDISVRLQRDTLGTATSATVTGLTDGTAYEVQARAQNVRGPGLWTQPTTITPGLPGAPTALELQSGGRSLAVSWTAPAADGGSAVTDYDLRHSSDNGVTWTVVENGTSAALSATLTGLVNGTAYRVAVRAGNTNGDGPWSASASAVAGAPAAPGAPTLDSGNASLAVSWTAPADHGSAITDYDVQYRACTDTVRTCPDADDTWGAWTTVSHTGTAVFAAITGLTNGTAHQVRVRAVNARGNGAWSAAVGLQPGAPSAPGAPTVAADASSVTVSWTAPASNGSAITDYDVRWQRAGTSAWSTGPLVGYNPGSLGDGRASDGTTGQALDLGTVSLSGVTVTKVTTGGIANVYRLGSAVGVLRVKLHGRNAAAAGKTYEARHAATAPGTGDMNTHGTLLWRRTVGVGGTVSGDGWSAALPAGSHFWVTTTTAGTTDEVTPVIAVDDVASAATSATFSGWTPGSTYRVQARAANARGEGTWSAATSQTVGVPAAPAAARLTPSDMRIDAGWDAPATTAPRSPATMCNTGPAPTPTGPAPTRMTPGEPGPTPRTPAPSPPLRSPASPTAPPTRCGYEP